jgi:hypothetical protein
MGGLEPKAETLKAETLILLRQGYGAIRPASRAKKREITTQKSGDGRLRARLRRMAMA